MVHTTVLARLHVAHAAVLDAHHHVCELADHGGQHEHTLLELAAQLEAAAETLRDAEQTLEWTLGR